MEKLRKLKRDNTHYDKDHLSRTGEILSPIFPESRKKGAWNSERKG